jgi:Flp pilus assembly protein TadD
MNDAQQPATTGDPLALYNEGNEKCNRKEYLEACALYKQALSIDPSLTEGWVNLGNTYCALQQYTESLAAYDRALALEPDLANIHYNRANALEELGNLDQAVDEYSRAIELDVSFAWAYGNRGHVLSRLHRHAEAVQDYNRAFELAPKDINTAWTFVWAHMEFATQAHLEEIIKELVRIASLDPDSSRAHLCLGVAALLRVETDEAFIHFDCAAELEPEGRDAPFWRGVLLALLRENEQAKACIEQAVYRGLPPVLLSPLRWVQTINPSFAQYATGLLQRYHVSEGG